MDFEDDWELLRGPPPPPPPKDVIGYLVLCHGTEDVSPRFPLEHREGEPEEFPIVWRVDRKGVCDCVRVWCLGLEVSCKGIEPLVMKPEHTVELTYTVQGLRATYESRKRDREELQQEFARDLLIGPWPGLVEP